MYSFRVDPRGKTSSRLSVAGFSILAGLAFLFLALQAEPMSAGQAGLSFLTSMGSDGKSGGAASHSAKFTADSRHILFLSEANNLAPNDGGRAFTDVFLYSMQSRSNLLVSVDRSGNGGGNRSSWEAMASDDGRFVVFSSLATNLTGDPVPSGVLQVFWRDTLFAVTRLVSANPSATGGNGRSFQPRISADGRHVVFLSEATDLAEQDFNQASDVFVWHSDDGRLELVSRDLTGERSAQGASDSASITPDGSAVLFRSSAQNLISFPENGLATSEVYLKDFITRTLRRISEPSIMVKSRPWIAREAAIAPAMSSSGRYVAYQLLDPERGAGGVILLDRDQPGVFWLKQWALLEQTFTRSPLVVSDAGPAVFSEVLSRAGSSSVLTAEVLRPTATNGCHSVSDEKPPLTPSLLGCFEVVPLATPRGLDLPLKGNPSSLSSDIQVAVRELPSSFPLFTQVELQKWFPEPVDVNDEEGPVDAIVSGVPGRPLLRFPIHASPGSLNISPDGLWIAFDTPVALDKGEDNNGVSDVFILSLTNQEYRLISHRLGDLPSHLALPKSKILVRGINHEGDRVAFGAAWPLLPSFTQNQPFREVLVQEGSTGELLPITAYQTPMLGDPAIGTTLLGSNEVLAVKMNDLGTLAAVLTINYRTPTLQLHDLEHGWRFVVENYSPYSPLNFPSWTWANTFSIDSKGENLVYQGEGNLFLARNYSKTNQPMVLTPSDYLGLKRSHGPNYCPSISPDGKWVAFFTQSTDLFSEEPGEGTEHLCLREILAAKTQKILSFQKLQPLERCEIVWNRESTLFAFVAPDLRWGVVNAASGTNRLMGSDVADLHLSASGRYVSATERLGYFPRVFQALRFDLLSNTREIVSTAPDGITPGNGHSHSTQLSPDGSRLFFASDASNLVSGDGNGTTDIFVRDFTTRQTTLLSQSLRGGRSGNGPSTRPILSGNGEVLVFMTAASDVVSNDFNGREDIVQIRFNEVDADHDGLPDAWERRYFSTITVTDGTTDSDGDGLPDAVEFALGSNPADPASKVGIELVPLETQAGWKVSWSIVPWKRFSVQYADSLTEPHWVDLAAPPLFSSTGSMTDLAPSSTGERFYRVVPAP